MMMFNQYEVETRLHMSLMRYGLNPNDWSLEYPSLDSGVRKIEISHREDSSLRLIGQAKIQSCGRSVIAIWKSLRLSREAF